MNYPMIGRERVHAAKHRYRRCAFGCTSDFESEWAYLRHLDWHHDLSEDRWRAEDDLGTVQAQFTERGQQGVVL